jgi:hypothetical protein
MKPTNEIRIFGLQRCGQHLIINWIIKQCKGKVLFVNNMKIDGGPLGGWRKMYYEDGVLKKLKSYDNLGAIDYYIYNYEDISFSDVPARPFFPAPCKFVQILVIRDLFNFMASRLKIMYTRKRGCKIKLTHLFGRKKILKYWIETAKEFLGETKKLKNKIGINFNSFFLNKAYRKNIADKLGLDFTDEGLNEVTKFGGGSSFDSTKYDGQAQKMGVLKRYMEFEKDATYRNLVNHSIAARYSKKIFNFIPPWVRRL